MNEPVVRMFEEIFEGWILAYEERHDHTAIREMFNAYVDSLQRDGQLTMEEAAEVENPY